MSILDRIRTAQIPEKDKPIVSLKEYLALKGGDNLAQNVPDSSAQVLDRYIAESGIDITTLGVTDLVETIITSLVQKYHLEGQELQGSAEYLKSRVDNNIIDNYVTFATGEGVTQGLALQRLAIIIADPNPDIALTAELAAFVDVNNRMNVIGNEMREINNRQESEQLDQPVTVPTAEPTNSSRPQGPQPILNRLSPSNSNTRKGVLRFLDPNKGGDNKQTGPLTPVNA